MRASGLAAIACAAAFTAACTGEVREENRAAIDTEQAETGDRVGTTGVLRPGETGGAAGVTDDAQEFVQRAARSGMAEIQLGQLASERAQNAEVKQFGQMMVRDHSKSSDELKQLVSGYGISMPTEPDDEHRELLEKLRNLRGAEFDREYMSAMVEGHRDMQELLEDRADDARSDPQSHAQTNPAAADSPRASFEAELNQWALMAQPNVDTHLETAERIQDALDGDARGARN